MSVQREIKIKKVDDILASALDLSDDSSSDSDGPTPPPAPPQADAISIPKYEEPPKKTKRGPPRANLEKAWQAKTKKKEEQEAILKKISELQAQLETQKAKRAYKSQLKETKREAKVRALEETVKKTKVDDELEIEALKNEIIAEMTKSKYLKDLAKIKPSNSKLETKVVQNPAIYEPPKMTRNQIVASFGF